MEEDDLVETLSPFLNVSTSEAPLKAAQILKELGYENLAIYPGGNYDFILVVSLEFNYILFEKDNDKC